MFYSTIRAKTCRRGSLLYTYARNVKDCCEDGAARKAAYESAVAFCTEAGEDPGVPAVLPDVQGLGLSSPRVLAASAAAALTNDVPPASASGGADAWDAVSGPAYIVQMRPDGQPRVLGRLDLRTGGSAAGPGSAGSGPATAPASFMLPPRGRSSADSASTRVLAGRAAANGGSLANGSREGYSYGPTASATAPAAPAAPQNRVLAAVMASHHAAHGQGRASSPEPWSAHAGSGGGHGWAAYGTSWSDAGQHGQHASVQPVRVDADATRLARWLSGSAQKGPAMEGEAAASPFNTQGVQGMGPYDALPVSVQVADPMRQLSFSSEERKEGMGMESSAAVQCKVESMQAPAMAIGPVHVYGGAPQPHRHVDVAATMCGHAVEPPTGAAVGTLTGEDTSTGIARMLTAASYDSLDAILLEQLGPDDMLVDERPMGQAAGQAAGPAGQAFRCLAFNNSCDSSHLAYETGEWSAAQPVSVSTIGRHQSCSFPASAAESAYTTGPAAYESYYGQEGATSSRGVPPAGQLSDFRSYNSITTLAYNAPTEPYAPGQWGAPACAKPDGSSLGAARALRPRAAGPGPVRGFTPSAEPYFLEAAATDAAVTLGLGGADVASFMRGWN